MRICVYAYKPILKFLDSSEVLLKATRSHRHAQGKQGRAGEHDEARMEAEGQRQVDYPG